MTDTGTTQDNFIHPAPPVGGLPISHDWLDRMKLVRDRTIPIILPSGKNILADTMFQIITGYTNLGKSKADLTAESAFSLPLMLVLLGTQPQIMSLLAKVKNTHFGITIPFKGCSSFTYYKAWRYEIIYLVEAGDHCQDP